jgi:hypothetical protein
MKLLFAATFAMKNQRDLMSILENKYRVLQGKRIKRPLRCRINTSKNIYLKLSILAMATLLMLRRMIKNR